MNTQAQNQDFGIPADVEASLREQAAKQVAGTIDEKALLAKFVAEEKAKREQELRIQASELVDGEVQDFDSQGFPKKYYKITIFKGNQKSDLSYVPVSVNGYGWKIARGELVIVPSVVLETLDHAVTEVPVQTEGGLITRPAHRFPYANHGEASAEEYEAFRVKMREVAGRTAVAA